MAYGIKVFNNTGGGVIDGYNFQLVFIGKVYLELKNLTNIWTTNGVNTGQWSGTVAFPSPRDSVLRTSGTYSGIYINDGIMTTPFAFIGGPQTYSDSYGSATLNSIALTNQTINTPDLNALGIASGVLYPQICTFSVSAVGTYSLSGTNSDITLIRPKLTAYIFDVIDTTITSNTGYGLNVKSQRPSTDAYSNKNTFTTTQVPLVISAYAKTNGQKGLQTLLRGSIPTNWAVCMGHLGWFGNTVYDTYSSSNPPADGQLLGISYTSPQTAYIDPAYYTKWTGGGNIYNYSCPINRAVENQYIMWIDRDLYD